MIQRLVELEAIVFERHAPAVDAAAVPLIFILGSPRTGSTPLYQLIVNAFDVFPISNLINDSFAEHPAVGALLDMQLNPRGPVAYASRYGKTESCFEPSEGSLMFQHWFGGEHPSQTCSTTALPERREHMIRSFAAMHAIAQRPVICKNAWNCFRIQDLAATFTASTFIWIRRDIEAAARSDLASRIAHGSPDRWNSATTTNYRELQERPYWEQVIEQQYEYNLAIEQDLRRSAHGRFVEVWYEELCASTEAVIDRLAQHCIDAGIPAARRPLPVAALHPSAGVELPPEDAQRLGAYVRQHEEQRLRPYRWAAHKLRHASNT